LSFSLMSQGGPLKHQIRAARPVAFNGWLRWAILGAWSVAVWGCQGNVIGAHASGTVLDSLVVTPAGGVQADDVSVLTLSDTIPPTAGVGPSQIVFAATAGVFPVDDTNFVTIPTGVGGGASVQLRAPRTPGGVRLSAGADGVVQSQLVRFGVAEPDALTLEPSAFTMLVSDTATVNYTLRVQLLRVKSPGLVSIGVPAVVSDTSNGRSVCTFGIVAPSDDSGIVRVTFSPGNGTGVPGVTLDSVAADTLYAAVKDSTGATIVTGTAVIVLVPQPASSSTSSSAARMKRQ
jgi:hypothetical protein